MTDVVQLFTGVGVLIDDEIQDNKSNVQKVINSFEDYHIPLLKYSCLPTDDEIMNMHSVSFVLLDWKWIQGVSDDYLLKENVAFIKKIHDICFTPIFIFTNENPDDIIRSLIEEGVYFEDKNNLIFVKYKDEVDNPSKLFSSIDYWVKNTLSVYVIKEWENKIRSATKRLFKNLYEINPNWVNVFLTASKKDSIDAAFELDGLLFENLHSQMTYINLQDLPKQDATISYNPDEIRLVMQGQRFISNEKELSDMVFTGDIFKETIDGKDIYYINVRPQCDCIPRDGMQINDVFLYLVQGEEKEIKKCSFNKTFGNFADTENRFTIFPINHKAIQFNLGHFSMRKYSEIRHIRIGRLLPPFITRLIQKYALYMQRQALPRIPEEATN